MDRYLSWIALWLVNQYVKLETWIQARVQDRIEFFSLSSKISKGTTWAARQVT